MYNTEGLTKEKTIKICYGLPGSGKTTWAKKEAKEDDPRGFYWRSRDAERRPIRINGDDIHRTLGKYGRSTDMAKEIAKDVLHNLQSSTNVVIIDALLTTNQHIEILCTALIETISAQYMGFGIGDVTFELHVWNPDREACLWNDQGREGVRGQGSTVTIQNAPYEEPAEEVLARYDLKVVRHTVQRKSLYQVWKNKLGYDEDDFRSDSWSTGGNHCDCWGGDYSINPEEPPASFTEFDELIGKLYPDISFMKYKMIYAACVDTETDSEGDYYGGVQYKAFYRCDLKKLYEALQETGLLKQEEISSLT